MSHEPDRTEQFEMLLACYRSGQISEKQWQAHLEDADFAKWSKLVEEQDKNG